MNFSNVLNLQVMMISIMIFGAFLRKKNIIRKGDARLLADLTMNFFLPCNILMAFCVEFSSEILSQGMMICAISLLIQLFCIFLSYILYNKYPKEKKMILQFGTICSNASFLGNPVAEGLYGSMGVLYASIYLIPQRIVMWSVGVAYFTESPDKKSLVKKVATHPCIITVFIGIAVMVSQVQVPTVVYNTISTIGGCTTTATMLLTGAILAETNTKSMLSWTQVKFACIRLIFIPTVVLIACKLCGVPEMIGGLAVVLAAMPAGASTTILAVMYSGDEEFATQCVVFTTVLSMVMIPIWCIILGMVY